MCFSRKNSPGSPFTQLPRPQSQPAQVSRDGSEPPKIEQDRTGSTDKTITKFAMFAHPYRTIPSDTLEIAACASREKVLPDHRPLNFPDRNHNRPRSHATAQNRPEPLGVAQDQTRSNKIEQDRTRSIDKTITKFAMFAHPDRTILSNTLKIVTSDPARKIRPKYRPSGAVNRSLHSAVPTPLG